MGATIVLIHGMCAGPWVWERFASIFEQRGHRCVAPTLRHHDAPPDQPPALLGRTSLLDYAADLERELDRIDEIPVLLGHSMGGKQARRESRPPCNRIRSTVSRDRGTRSSPGRADIDSDERADYYARVLENPSRRSAHERNALPGPAAGLVHGSGGAEGDQGARVVFADLYRPEG